MDKMQYDDLVERLLELDEEISLRYSKANRMHLVIVGGGALILLRVIARGTLDIDALNASSELRDSLERYDINTKVQTFINNFPYNYEDRLVPLNLNGKIIDFFTASLEDIVIAKLYSHRPPDMDDIISPSVLEALDWDLLHQLATSEDEAKASALNEMRYREFLDAFENYERRYRPCGN